MNRLLSTLSTKQLEYGRNKDLTKAPVRPSTGDTLGGAWPRRASSFGQYIRDHHLLILQPSRKNRRQTATGMEATSATDLMAPLKASLRKGRTAEQMRELHEQPRRITAAVTAMVASDRRTECRSDRRTSTEVRSLRLCLVAGQVHWPATRLQVVRAQTHR